MTTIHHRIRELLVRRGFLDGWSYDAQVFTLLNELVVCGEMADEEVDWRTMESRSGALESWNRRAA